MKKRFLVACLMIMLTATAAIAHNNTQTDGEGYNSVINDFIDSHMHSNYKKLSAIMDESSSLKMARGTKVLQQNKSSLIDAMKQEKGTQQNCLSAYEVLAKSDAIVIARVDFSYHDSIQHDYLTLERDDNQDWKITHVYKMFEDLESAGSSPAVVAKN